MSTNVLVASSLVKLYAGITSTDYDQLIEDLNPIVLDDITNYCKNSFVNSTMFYHDEQLSFSTSTGDNSIFNNDTGIELDEFVNVGDIIYVTDTIYNNCYFSIASVNTTQITTNETVVTESTGDGRIPLIVKTQYPKDLPFIASRMIKHLIDVQGRNDVISESLGDYSYTLGEITSAGGNMYPANILTGLTKYRKVQFI